MTEKIRAGGLGPALELGVTPSHVSLAAAQSIQSIQSSSLPGEEELGEGLELSEDEVEGQFDDPYGDGVYCIPLESVGLGGNQITSVGAAALADGLKSNTSERLYYVPVCVVYVQVSPMFSLSIPQSQDL